MTVKCCTYFTIIASWNSNKLTVEIPLGLSYNLNRLALKCAVQWEIVGTKKGDFHVALFDLYSTMRHPYCAQHTVSVYNHGAI